MKPFALALTAAFGAALCLGCAAPETVQHHSTLTAYLGAKSTSAPEVAERPVRLQLPLRLGIAFVPGGPGQRQGSLMGSGAPNPLGASQEQDLHQRVSALFESKPWTQSFKVIPSQYLAKEGGFDDLAKVARAFHVDVVALVSVEQIQFSQPRWYAWTYWTLVGAYMVKGDKNDTATLVDAAIYHVPSRTFLFRAGATGTVKGDSTWSQREDAFRQQSHESLRLAMEHLSVALDQGVAGFKQDLLKGTRHDVLLVDRDGNPLGSANYDPTRR